jgi:hypothetical protein
MAWVEDGHISTPHDSTQGRAKQTSTVHQHPLYGTSNTAVHFMGRMELAVLQTFSVGNNNVVLLSL